MSRALLFAIVIVMMLGVSAVGTVLLVRVEAIRHAHQQLDRLHPQATTERFGKRDRHRRGRVARARLLTGERNDGDGDPDCVIGLDNLRTEHPIDAHL